MERSSGSGVHAIEAMANVSGGSLARRAGARSGWWGMTAIRVQAEPHAAGCTAGSRAVLTQGATGPVRARALLRRPPAPRRRARGLRRATELREPVGDRRRAVGVGEHADRRLARIQVNREARLVGIARGPRFLWCIAPTAVPPRTPTPRTAGPSERQRAADSGALAGASRADLVLLELAVGIEGEDADGVAMSDPGVLQRHGGVVRREFLREE